MCFRTFSIRLAGGGARALLVPACGRDQVHRTWHSASICNLRRWGRPHSWRAWCRGWCRVRSIHVHAHAHAHVHVHTCACHVVGACYTRVPLESAAGAVIRPAVQVTAACCAEIRRAVSGQSCWQTTCSQPRQGRSSNGRFGGLESTNRPILAILRILRNCKPKSQLGRVERAPALLHQTESNFRC